MMAKSGSDYCDIAGMSVEPDRPCFYSHDGATCSLIRVSGTPLILADDEFTDRMVDFADQVGPIFSKRGHGMTISYERSANTAEELDVLFGPMRESAERKGLKIDTVLDETRLVLERNAVAERVIIAVWTYKDAVVPEQFREEVAERKSRMGHLPINDYVQTGEGPYKIMAATHFAVVSSIQKALTNVGIQNRLLGLGQSDAEREDLAEVRRGILFHETPMTWQPSSRVRYPKVSRKKSASVASFFAPSLNKVLMTSAARASSDLRTVEIGGRKYALAQMTLFPREMEHFSNLKAHLGSVADRSSRMPFRIAFHMEGGAKVNGFKQALATILSPAAATNKMLYRAMNGANESMANDHDTWLNARCVACTWVEPGEHDGLLNDRRSTLIRALTSWRGPSVADSAADPMRLLAETVSGMTAVSRAPVAALTPIRELAKSFPFGGYAPPEADGETIFTTMDAKVAPFKAHSPKQTSWLNLLWAPPGSGKSVLMNAMNVDFAAYHNSAKLPFIGSLDVGISSSGFIETIRAALPPERKAEVCYIKLQNESRAREYFINPFDLGLGRRRPLSREASFTANFLAEILKGVQDPSVSAVIDTVLSNLYRTFSDLEVSSSVRMWQPDKDNELDDLARDVGIELHEYRSWWSIVDDFMRAGKPHLAARAQRYAMPTLSDVISALSEHNVRAKFGQPLCEACKVQVEAAVNRYPIFSNETRLDIGDARIVAIDLEGVVEKNPSHDADLQRNTLMFLTARDLFIRKVSGSADEIPNMDLPNDPELKALYEEHWGRVFSEITTIRKRFTIDEFHITGASKSMVNQINQDVRHGRKWGFEIMLASQLIKDFSDLIDMASNVFVLKSDTEQSLKEMKQVLGVSDATLLAVKRNVNGPGVGGAIIMLLRRTKDGDSCLLLNNRIGPVRLWALTTTFEDRKIRDALYTQTGSVDLSLEILAERFPHGTAVTHWNEVQKRATPSEDVPVAIATELLMQHNTRSRADVA
jgi:intracellular multiplication protein IcmB